jgi:hypothetical protein
LRVPATLQATDEPLIITTYNRKYKITIYDHERVILTTTAGPSAEDKFFRTTLILDHLNKSLDVEIAV